MNLGRIITQIKSALLSLGSSHTDDNESENNSTESTTLISIGENKNSQILRATFHPDAFFAAIINLVDEPPQLSSSNTIETGSNNENDEIRPIQLKLTKYSPKIQFTVTISTKLCELGYARVVAMDFFEEIKEFIPTNIVLTDNFKKHHLYIPMTVELPVIQQRHGLFDDLMSPTLIAWNTNPKLYRYKLTEAFLWRYQYVRYEHVQPVSNMFTFFIFVTTESESVPH